MSNGIKIMNRQMVAVGAILIQLCLGAIYAWSVYTKILVEAGWSKAETQIVFSAGLALFAISMIIAGRFMPKVGPRKLTILSGIVLGIGYILAGLLGGQNFWVTFFFVGIVGGCGIGIGYVVPIAVGMRWFPDKKGLITGLAVAGFGFGATLWMTLADSLGKIGGGHLLTHLGLSQTFIVYGIAYIILVLIGSKWMVFPPDGWKPEGWTPPEAKPGTSSGLVDFMSGEMLRTPQFYMIFFTFLFGASAGLMSIGLMKLFPMEAMQAKGIDKESASYIATMAMGVCFALLNGFGRIIWGMISDKMGRKLSIIIMLATQGIFVILFQWMAGTPLTLYLFAMLIGFNFGGTLALFPAITADTFGTKNIGMNYGWVFLAYGVGGIFGPIMGGMLGDMKNFPLAFTISGILCLVAVCIIAFIKPPVKKMTS
jgi:OFA family oxalate/formate antiporter-like MFS transporter